MSGSNTTGAAAPGASLSVPNSVTPNASMTTLTTSNPPLAFQPPFTLATELQFDKCSTPSSTPGAKVERDRLLPATYRNSSHETKNVRSDVNRFVLNELDLSRLAKVSSYLWTAGMKNNARALNRQVAMNRSIVAIEQMDMHLVWHDNTIYVKPLPAWLLSHSFWTDHLCQSHGAETEKVYGEALGFLVSYSWLVCSPTDFHIAKTLHLLPEQVTYEGWNVFMNAITEPSVSMLPLSPRYHFGELRLQRLNMVYRYAPHLRLKHFVRGYFFLHRTYSSFFARRFGWIAITVFAYVTIVLAAMQVGMSTALGQNNAFSKASEWFAVVSLVLPAAVVVLAAILGVFFVLNNLWFTVDFLLKKRRARSRTGGGQRQSVV